MAVKLFALLLVVTVSTVDATPQSLESANEEPRDACSWATKCMNSENVCQPCNKSPFKGDDRCVCGPNSKDWIHKGECKTCDMEIEEPRDACSWATKCMNSENVCQPCNKSPFKGDDRCVCGPNSEDWIHKGECKPCDSENDATPFVNAGTLALNWKDCGDASTHGKVSDLSPKTLTLGQITLTTGTGTLNEAVQGGGFTIDMKAGIISKHWTGELCTAKTFSLPLNAGNVTWKGLKCPLTAGSVSVPLDIYLSSALPGFLTKSTINVGATAASGDKLLCMEIDTEPMTRAPSEIVV